MSTAREKQQGLAIADLTSGVQDNGRRGNPRPGCDCEQCFGYCLVDTDEAARAGFDRRAKLDPHDLVGLD